jgi:glucosamine-6-phosphate deaminase
LIDEKQQMLPDYLTISASKLGQGQPVKVRIKGDAASIAQDMAEAMLDEIRGGGKEGRGATLIIPVGPVDQFPILARMLNEQKISCRETVFINMDEYLTEGDQWLPQQHPLSFRAFMSREFYDRIDPALGPLPQHRVFPDPQNPSAVQKMISARGGVDACFGGIGINGHVAFNEPPEPGETMSLDAFAALPTRALSLSRETRTINSVTVGGEISVVPERAVTVGMKEILASRRLRLYCNRSWQSAVVRRVLHGPISTACPASLVRLHPDASLTIADYVAAPPNICLR